MTIDTNLRPLVSVGVVKDNNSYLMSSSDLFEVIRQSYVIGIDEGHVLGHPDQYSVRWRCKEIYKEINRQMIKIDL